MSVVNIQHDTQIKTNMSLNEFAHGMHQLDLSNIPIEKRKLAVIRHLTRMAASEATDAIKQRHLLSNYLEASKNDPDA